MGWTDGKVRGGEQIVRPSHATELTAAVAAALERLDRYRSLLGELLHAPDDASLYQRNSEAFDAMGALTATVPQVRVCWVEVLISRFELLDAVGRAEVVEPEYAAGLVAGLHAKHLTTLETFQRLCWLYISSNLVVPGRRREASPRTALEIAQWRVLEAEGRVKHQRELIQRLEARGADASDARRLLRIMEKVLEVMYFNFDIVHERSNC